MLEAAQAAVACSPSSRLLLSPALSRCMLFPLHSCLFSFLASPLPCLNLLVSYTTALPNPLHLFVPFVCSLLRPCGAQLLPRMLFQSSHFTIPACFSARNSTLLKAIVGDGNQWRANRGCQGVQGQRTAPLQPAAIARGHSLSEMASMIDPKAKAKLSKGSRRGLEEEAAADSGLAAGAARGVTGLAAPPRPTGDI